MNSPTPYSDPRLIAALVEPLTAHQLEARLDEALDPVLSSRRTARPLAENLAPLARDLQDFALHWVNVIARTSGEMAYQFAALAPDALRRLDTAAAETWIIQAIDTFDREGLHRGSGSSRMSANLSPHRCIRLSRSRSKMRTMCWNSLSAGWPGAA